MDTTIVIEAWTNLMTPVGFVAALLLEALIVGVAIGVGFAMGKETR